MVQRLTSSLPESEFRPIPRDWYGNCRRGVPGGGLRP